MALVLQLSLSLPGCCKALARQRINVALTVSFGIRTFLSTLARHTGHLRLAGRFYPTVDEYQCIWVVVHGSSVAGWLSFRSRCVWMLAVVVAVVGWTPHPGHPPMIPNTIMSPMIPLDWLRGPFVPNDIKLVVGVVGVMGRRCLPEYL